MPRGDGTGPWGQGPGTGKGNGGCEKKTAPLAVIDAGTCVSCGACIDTCPAGALIMKDIAVVDTLKCTGCGACVNICSAGAIALKPR
ncbi:MAG TPA: ferredoxin [Elusimicrobia bacterium]|nr:ferredoxin [Elusimicrobiota bacterium]HCE98547.1 ferredoxin [Elusimicrobiota bacterium]